MAGTYVYQKLKTMRFETETLRFLGQMLWRILPTDIKESESLSMFKRKLKRTRLVVTADYTGVM